MWTCNPAIVRVALYISGKLVTGASHFNGRSGQVIVPMLDGILDSIVSPQCTITVA